MKEIPVLLGFDQSQQIGTLTVDESKLPSKPNFVFALGYLIKPEDGGPFELLAVSVVEDANYAAYLRQQAAIDAMERTL